MNVLAFLDVMKHCGPLLTVITRNALAFLDEMQHSGLQPNVITFNALAVVASVGIQT